MKLNQLTESRKNEYGRPLPETGYQYKKVEIFRAVDADQDYFLPEDYVTRLKKFAVGHADHNVVTQETPQKVLRAIVNASDVYEATNAGEYFYDGKKIKGKVIYEVDSY